MSRIRTFLAVEVSPSVRRQAGELIEMLRPAGGGAKWVAPQNLHMTLAFLGDVDETEIHEVCLAAGKAAAPLSAFSIHCAGLGAFPRIERPTTIWLGVQEGADDLCALQDAVAGSLQKIGFRREHRKFHPHLTLGRVRRGKGDPRDLSAALAEHGEFSAGECDIDEVVVFSSRLTPDGPIHEALSRAELA